ncbi:zinc-binding dehydrogenase [Desertivirga brevis]|uniref:zinc-binding dehydrogenase n=1 Tax=Desertivirga brevis TaxID=2810310 RepID=UPI001A959CB7|nr:zinc-binding dehydrogenase [Pedobacter sp. SYSU D00873]
MKAAVLENYGDAEQFELKEIAVPQIKEGEILVRNRASSINPVDTLVRQGKLKMLSGFTSGQVIGSDFSGTVIASKSTRFKPGDEVFGQLDATKGGAYSELLVADEDCAALKPSNISFTEAASLPLVALTAFQGIVYDGKIRQGAKVLILGCTGGVGTAAVQIAKSFDAQVTGTCSEAHVEFAKSLGCDKVINYEKERVSSNEVFDLIFDCSGNYTIADYETNLSPDALFVSTRGGAKDTTGAAKAAISVLLERRMKIVKERPNTADLMIIKDLVELGQLKPYVAHTFPLEEIREAHRFMENESLTGKVAIEIRNDGSPAIDNYLQNQQQNRQDKNYVREILATGFIAGMRSLSAPVVARKLFLNIAGNQLHSSRLRFLQSPAVSMGLKALAATEFLGDKMPAAPARIQPLSLGMRAMSGAISSAAVAKKTKHNTYVGAVLGGAAAVLATYGMYYLRTRIAKRTKLPDFILGLAEDALVVAAGAGLSKTTRNK